MATDKDTQTTDAMANSQASTNGNSNKGTTDPTGMGAPGLSGRDRGTDTNDPQQEPIPVLQQFHSALIEDQAAGVVRGIPEDYQDFEYSIADEGYRRRFHNYLLAEQVAGNVRGIPRDLTDFTKEFAPDVYTPEPAGQTNTDDIADAAVSSTIDMSLLDAPGLSSDMMEAMQAEQRISKSMINSIGEAGKKLRQHLKKVTDHHRGLVSTDFLGFTYNDDNELSYIDQLKETSNNLKGQLFQAYSTLKNERDRLEAEQEKLKETYNVPDVQGGYSGMNPVAMVNHQRVPDNNKEAYNDLQQRIDEIDEKISEVQPSGADRFRHSANTFLKSFTGELPAGFFEGIAVLSSAANKMMRVVGQKTSPTVGGGIEVVRKLLEGEPGKYDEVKELATWQLGQKIREVANDKFPTDPTMQDSFVESMLPAAFGSFGAFAAGGFGARVVKMSAGAVAGTAAGTGGMGQAYSMAKAYGASEEDAQLAGQWGFVPGVIQVLPVMRLIDRYDRAAGGMLKKSLRDVFKEGAAGSLEEGLVEAAGQAGFEVIADQIYRKEPELLKSMSEIGQAGGAGAIAGFVANIITGGAARGLSRQRMQMNQQPASDQQGSTGDGTPPTDVDLDGPGIDWDSSAPIGDQINEINDELETLQAVRDMMADQGQDTSEFDQILQAGYAEVSRLEYERASQNRRPEQPSPTIAGLLSEGQRGNEALTITEPQRQKLQQTQQTQQDLATRGTLGDAVGSRVDYNGYTGVLRQDNEGTFIVETIDGISVEVADAQKNPDAELSDLGVQRNFASMRQFRYDPDADNFVMEMPGETEGQTETARFEYVRTNTNDAGVPVSVTMTNEAGQKRTFRAPEAVEDVIWGQFFSEGTDMVALDRELRRFLEGPDDSDGPGGPPPTAPGAAPVVIPDTEFTLDDGDARLEPVFTAFDQNGRLTEQEQSDALDWANEKLTQIANLDPPNADQLISTLEQFELEVLTYGNEQTTPDMGDGPTNADQAEVSEPASGQTQRTTGESDGPGLDAGAGADGGAAPGRATTIEADGSDGGQSGATESVTLTSRRAAERTVDVDLTQFPIEQRGESFYMPNRNPSGEVISEGIYESREEALEDAAMQTARMEYQRESERMRQEDAAAERAAREQRDARVNQFTSDMSDMQAGRVKASLEKQIQYQDNIYTRRGLVEALVGQGYRVRDGRLYDPQGEGFLEADQITKTAIDYAEFLQSPLEGQQTADEEVQSQVSPQVKLSRLAEQVNTISIKSEIDSKALIDAVTEASEGMEYHYLSKYRPVEVSMANKIRDAVGIGNFEYRDYDGGRKSTISTTTVLPVEVLQDLELSPLGNQVSDVLKENLTDAMLPVGFKPRGELSPDGNSVFYVLSKSTKADGNYQLTTYDVGQKGGIMGDGQFDTIADAIDDVTEGSFTTIIDRGDLSDYLDMAASLQQRFDKTDAAEAIRQQQEQLQAEQSQSTDEPQPTPQTYSEKIEARLETSNLYQEFRSDQQSVGEEFGENFDEVRSDWKAERFADYISSRLSNGEEVTEQDLRAIPPEQAVVHKNIIVKIFGERLDESSMAAVNRLMSQMDQVYIPDIDLFRVAEWTNTIKDIDGSDEIKSNHLFEAIIYERQIVLNEHFGDEFRKDLRQQFFKKGTLERMEEVGAMTPELKRAWDAYQTLYNTADRIAGTGDDAKDSRRYLFITLADAFDKLSVRQYSHELGKDINLQEQATGRLSFEDTNRIQAEVLEYLNKEIDAVPINKDRIFYVSETVDVVDDLYGYESNYDAPASTKQRYGTYMTPAPDTELESLRNKPVPEEASIITEDLSGRVPKKADKIQAGEIDAFIYTPPEYNRTPSQRKWEKDDPISMAVSTDELRPAMMGVYYDGDAGGKVATDGHILLFNPDGRVKSNKIVDPKTGNEINEQFPNWQAVVPRADAQPYRAQLTDDQIDLVYRNHRAAKFIEGKGSQSGIELIITGDSAPRIVVDSENMRRVVQALKDMGAGDLELRYSEPNRAMLVIDTANTDRFGLIMPLLQGYGSSATGIGPYGVYSVLTDQAVGDPDVMRQRLEEDQELFNRRREDYKRKMDEAREAGNLSEFRMNRNRLQDEAEAYEAALKDAQDALTVMAGDPLPVQRLFPNQWTSKNNINTGRREFQGITPDDNYFITGEETDNGDYFVNIHTNEVSADDPGPAEYSDYVPADELDATVNEALQQVRNEPDVQIPNEFEQRAQQIRGELSTLMDDFNKLIQGGLYSGIDPRLVAQAARIIAKGTQLGFVRFQQFANYVIENYGADFWADMFDSFKAAYVARKRKKGDSDEDLDAIQNSTAEDWTGGGEESQQAEVDGPIEPPTTPPDNDTASSPNESDGEGDVSQAESIDFWPRIPSIFEGKGFEAYRRTFEGAAEFLERTPGLEKIGKAIKTYFDAEQANQGKIASIMDDAMKQAFGVSVTGMHSLRAMYAELTGKNNAVEAEFEAWAYALDRGDNASRDAAYRKMSPEGKALADAWYEFAQYAGERLQQAGVQVYDKSLGEFRDISPIEFFWPRRLKPKFEAALRSPDKHPEDYARFVQILLDEGFITERSEAHEYISTQRDRPKIVEGDYFAGIEMARTDGFPEQVYDHRLVRGIEYAYRWADRIAQIEAFGQAAANPEGDIFDQAQQGIVDEQTRDYLTVIQRVIYRSTDPAMSTKIMATLNQIATGLMLGNPGTATLNIIGGLSLNNMAYGIDAMAAYKDLVTEADNIKDARELGIINNDYLRLIHDADGLTPEWLQRGVTAMMNIGGYTITERTIRLHAFLAANRKLDRAIDTWMSQGFDSAKGREEALWFSRQGFDPYTLVQEAEKGEYRESGRRTGPEIDRFLRYGVNLTQGSYRVDQVPLWAETPYGRFLFKYWKFANQLSRLFATNHLEPFMKAMATPSGESMELKNPITGETEIVKNPRARTAIPMLRYFAFSAGGGMVLTALRGAIFGYQSLGPEWDEVEKALEDEERGAAFALGMQIAFEGSIATGGIGVLQYPYLWTRDFAERRRAYDPTDPPGIAIVKETLSLGAKLFEQGYLTRTDVMDYTDRVISLTRTTRRATLYGLGLAGSEMDAAQLEMANREINYVRSLARRYSSEQDIAGVRRSPGAFGSTPNTPVNRAIVDALKIGAPGKAQAILKEHVDSFDLDTPEGLEKAESAIRSAKASVRMRQPALINGAPSESVRRSFLQWVNDNVTEQAYQRVERIDQQYRNAAYQAGIMTSRDWREAPDLNRRERPERAPSAADRRDLYRSFGIRTTEADQ